MTCSRRLPEPRPFPGLLLVAVFVSTAQAWAQSVPTYRLSKAEATPDSSFGEIRGVRELSDGRVVIVDAFQRLVLVGDLKTGVVSMVGRQAVRWDAYAWPDRLCPLGPDSALVHDAIGGIYHLVVGNAAGVTVHHRYQLAGNGRTLVTPPVPLLASDEKGRLYGPVGGRMHERAH